MIVIKKLIALPILLLTWCLHSWILWTWKVKIWVYWTCLQKWLKSVT